MVIDWLIFVRACLGVLAIFMTFAGGGMFAMDHRPKIGTILGTIFLLIAMVSLAFAISLKSI